MWRGEEAGRDGSRPGRGGDRGLPGQRLDPAPAALRAVHLYGRRDLQAEGRTGSLEQVEAFTRDGGLTAPAWFPLELDAEGQADADEVRHRQEHQAEVARTAAHVELPPPQRQADVVELMCRLGLLHRHGPIEAATTRWQVARP